MLKASLTACSCRPTERGAHDTDEEIDRVFPAIHTETDWPVSGILPNSASRLKTCRRRANDSLTQLANRSYFDEKLAEMIRWPKDIRNLSV
jgi:GGDEF domain-containing protein